jgi:hypothetical protein
MRRRQAFAQLNPRDNRAPVPSGAGMGAAAVTPPLPPFSPILSREEEEALAEIWTPTMTIEEAQREGLLTPQTDPTANVPKKKGWPKGKKRKP